MKSLLGNFYRHLAIFIWSTLLVAHYLISKNVSANKCSVEISNGSKQVKQVLELADLSILKQIYLFHSLTCWQQKRNHGKQV